ncbi:LPXTG cell wall anchor domain-containing protein [Kitasatospora azatica]|uniref:LPXTG cell wall anchor domain-containing protein n=1 Tax=Kitasatospora azatica TaxID=58347 RepID=UPI000B107B0C|nr:LPXTG cell wall anchor domain-containing protein [Kitasatospora azatica]
MYRPCVPGTAAVACGSLAATGSSHTVLLTAVAATLVVSGALLTRFVRQRSENG